MDEPKITTQKPAYLFGLHDHHAEARDRERVGSFFGVGLVALFGVVKLKKKIGCCL